MPTIAANLRLKTMRGFTLLEVIAVIAIIGFLTMIALPSIEQARAKSRNARRAADLRQLSNAINLYYADKGYLPRNSSGWCTYISHPVWGPGFQADIYPSYIPKVPLDPKYAGTNQDYFYRNNNNSTGNFILCAVKENSPGAGTYDTQYGTCDGWSTNYNYCITP